MEQKKWFSPNTGEFYNENQIDNLPQEIKRNLRDEKGNPYYGRISGDGNDLSNLSNENTKLKNKIIQLESQLADRNTQANNLSRENTDLNVRINRLNKKFEDSDKEVIYAKKINKSETRKKRCWRNLWIVSILIFTIITFIFADERFFRNKDSFINENLLIIKQNITKIIGFPFPLDTPEIVPPKQTTNTVELTAKQNEIDKLKQEIATLRKNNTTTPNQNDISRMQKEMTILKQENSTLKQENMTFKANQGSSTTDNTISRLQVENRNLNSSNQEKDKKIMELERYNQSLKNTIEEFRRNR